MKLLFLDIDGVLNSKESMERNFNENNSRKLTDIPCPILIENLNRILRGTGTRFVLSSVWRKGNFLSVIDMLLQSLGFEGSLDFETPDMRFSRGDDIREFFNKVGKKDLFGNSFFPESMNVSNICILDDDSDMSEFSPFLVQTTWEKGLEDKHVEMAIEMLNSSVKDGDKLWLK